MALSRKILMFCIVAVAVAATYRAYRVLNKPRLTASGLPQGIHENPQDLEQKGFEGYNYPRLLHLVEQSQEARSAFYQKFIDPASRAKSLKEKELQALLADLYREKMRLEHHIKNLKVYYKSDVPRKKAQALRYYQKVIEKQCHDLEVIIRNR